MTDYKPNVTKSIDNVNELEEKINNLQEKNVTYTESGNYTIEPDEKYFALEKVNVDVDIAPAVLQEKEVTITENGETTIEPDEGYNGLSSVNVTTSVEGVGIDINYLKNLPTTTNSPILKGIKSINFDTSEITNFKQMFYQATQLSDISNLKTDNAKVMTDCFRGCRLIESVPEINTENVEDFSKVFTSCTSLKNVPVLNLSKCKNMNQCFESIFTLTDESLENIAKSMLTLPNDYTGTKTLENVFATAHAKTYIPTLSEWTELQAKGWSVS